MDRKKALELFTDLLKAFDKNYEDDYLSLYGTDICEAAILAHDDIGYVSKILEYGNILPDRLQEICKAEAEGRLKILPCKPGDTVFRLCGTKNNRYIGERIANAITFNYNGETVIFSTVQGVLGKTVFLSKEQAEAALKEETP